MVDADGGTYWLTSVAEEGQRTPLEVARYLVVDEPHLFAISAETKGRRPLRVDDSICFYVKGNVGVVAHARIAAAPHHSDDPSVTDDRKFPYVFELEQVQHYLDAPVPIDSSLRRRLNAFAEKDPDRPWSWFVRGLHTVTKRDFGLLTGTSDSGPGRTFLALRRAGGDRVSPAHHVCGRGGP